MRTPSSEHAVPLETGTRTNRWFWRIAIAITIGMVVGAAVSVWDETQSGAPVERVPVGTDFATFYSAASLVLDGDGKDVFVPSAFGERIARVTSYEEQKAAVYGHPPFFPFLLLPFAYLPFVPAYLAFVLAGVGFLSLMVTRVGSVRPWVVVGLMLVSIPGFATAQLGQTGFWAAGALLAVYLALRRGDDFQAGVILGLLAFKPYYAAGVAIWWLLRPRRFLRALGGAASSGVGLVLVGFLIPDGWAAYRTFASESLASVLDSVAVSGFSLYEMWAMLLPGPLSTVMWLASAAAVLLVFRRFIIRMDHQLELSFAAAVIVGMLAASRLGWYDWVLLTVPATLLWKALPQHRDRLKIAGLWLIPVAALSWPVARGLDSAFGIYLQVAPLALAVVAWWFVAGVDLASADKRSPVLSTAADSRR